MDKYSFYKRVGQVMNETGDGRIVTAIKIYEKGGVEEAVDVLNLIEEFHKVKKQQSMLETRYGLMRRLAKEAVIGHKTTFEDYIGGQSFITDDGYPLDGESDAAYEEFMSFSKELDALRMELTQ